MSSLATTDYAWFVMVGLSIGWILELIFNTFIRDCINPFLNMILGIVICVMCGIIGQLIGLSTTLLFAGLGTLLILFIYDLLRTTVPKLDEPKTNEIIIKRKL